MRYRPSPDLFVTLIAALASAYLTHLRFSTTFQFEEAASLSALVNGTAETPFQYRALIPWLVSGALSAAGMPADGAALSAAFACSEALSFFLIYAGFTTLVRLELGERARPGLLGLSILWVLPFNLLLYPGPRFWYPSDVPAIAFTVLALCALRTGRLRYYYPILILATLNRETSIFFLLYFLASERPRMPAGSLLTHLAAQATLWLALKTGLYWIYADNPGAGAFMLKIGENIDLFKQPVPFLTVCSACGFALLPVLLWRGQIPGSFARSAIWVSVPFLAGMFCVGNLWELRVLAELAPITLLAYLTLVTPPAGAERATIEPG